MNVDYIDHMGSDNRIVDAARVSFDKIAANYSDDDNARLLRFLAKHRHITPFQHPQITLRVQAPIPVRTQLFKHKVGLTENEESRRYIKTTPPLFVPAFRSAPEGSIKQGSAGPHPDNRAWQKVYESQCDTAIDLYEQMLEANVAPEQARFILPQGVEVQWYWTGSLGAFARVCWQRLDSHAQAETQQIAQEISDIIAPLFPVSWAALTEGAA